MWNDKSMRIRPQLYHYIIFFFAMTMLFYSYCLLSDFGFLLKKTKYFDLSSCNIRTEISFCFIPISSEYSTTKFCNYRPVDQLKKLKEKDEVEIEIIPYALPGFCHLMDVHICCRYGRIPLQINEINQYWEEGNISIESRRNDVELILQMWKNDNGCNSVNDYIERNWSCLVQRRMPGNIGRGMNP